MIINKHKNMFLKDSTNESLQWFILQRKAFSTSLYFAAQIAMTVLTLIDCDGTLQKTELEISLIPGLPQIHFLGLADQVIKESVLRLKSTFKNNGWDFPKYQQIVVNIRPLHLKKSSRGLDLAVALGLLAITDQLPWKIDFKNDIIYGELDLQGFIHCPDDLLFFSNPENLTVITGTTTHAEAVEPSGYGHCTWILQKLNKDFDFIKPTNSANIMLQTQRPLSGLELSFSLNQALGLKLIALTQSPTLLAGPSGSGKTTLAQSALSFLTPPTPQELRNIQNNLKKDIGLFKNWRPFLQPHHSSSVASILGGGTKLQPGDLEKAQHGILLLDEMLEFSPATLEGLREPMENGKYRLSRTHSHKNLDLDIMILATTNFCPCGDWTPQKITLCKRSLYQCRRYLQKLSGPLIDRFGLLIFTKNLQQKDVSVPGQEILDHLVAVEEWRYKMSSQNPHLQTPIKQWSKEDLLRDSPEFYRTQVIPRWSGSQRRVLHTLKTARALAFLDFSLQLEGVHIEEALKWSWDPFIDLRKHC